MWYSNIQVQKGASYFVHINVKVNYHNTNVGQRNGFVKLNKRCDI